MKSIKEIVKEVNSIPGQDLDIEFKLASITLSKIYINFFNITMFIGIVGGLCGFISLLMQILK